MQPFDEDITIPEDNISNFQREAAYLLVTGKGLKNPLANKIERARGCVQRQIDEFQLIIDTIESGIQSAEGCYQCGDFPLQCAIEVKAKLEELMFEIDLLEIHTNRVSGADQNRVDEFLSRLTLAGQYTRAMKTLTGENKERYTHVFNSLINGDYCMEKICKETTCVPGNALCDEFNEQSGIGGLSVRLKQNPAGCNCAINLLIPGLIECVSGLIQDDELNYCEALRVVRKYSGGTQLTTEALSDPLVSQLMDTLFASNALKGPLQKIREGNLNAEEIEAEAKKYYEEFVDPGGTLECGLEGVTVVAGPTGPPGPQGAPGCAGPPGEPGQNCNCPGDDPKGACCVGEYCTQVTAQQCAFFGGDYYGDGSECYDPNTGLGVRCFPPGGCGIDEDCDPGLICCNGTCVQPCPAEVGGGCPPCAPCPPNSTECPAGSGNCCPTVGGEFICCNGVCTQPCPYSNGCPTCGDGTCCDAPGETCCGGVSCCTLEACCGNGFCCGAGQVCCDGQYCCPEGACCGGQCYDPSIQQCCNNVPKPIDDPCCEEQGDDCSLCEQVAAGIITGCNGEQRNHPATGDVCCQNGSCCGEVGDNAGIGDSPYNNPNAGTGALNECCAENETCCDGYGCCPDNWQCCSSDGPDGSEGKCCPPGTACCDTADGCCPEGDTCCEGADGVENRSFCCPEGNQCCQTDLCGNMCLGVGGFDSTTEEGQNNQANYADICECLRGEAQDNLDLVYKGGCECGCPGEGDIECGDQCCPEDTGYDPSSPSNQTGVCCDEYPPGTPEENRVPQCCPEGHTCCPDQGCTLLGECPCGQSECVPGVCCNDRRVIDLVPVKDGDPVCLGDIEEDDNGVELCVVKEQCCGTQCFAPTDCRKYVEDYVYFGLSADQGGANLCCCPGDVFGENGCCSCEEDGVASRTCQQSGVSSADGSEGEYTILPTADCGCPCDCAQNAGNAIVPDCKKECPYGGNPAEEFTMKRNQPALDCEPEELPRDCDGLFLQLLCSGKVVQRCPDDIPDYCEECPDAAGCSIQACPVPACCITSDCPDDDTQDQCPPEPFRCAVPCFDSEDWPPTVEEMCERSDDLCNGEGSFIHFDAIECDAYYRLNLSSSCPGNCPGGGGCADVCGNSSLDCGQYCGESCASCCECCEPDGRNCQKLQTEIEGPIVPFGSGAGNAPIGIPSGDRIPGEGGESRQGRPTNTSGIRKFFGKRLFEG